MPERSVPCRLLLLILPTLALNLARCEPPPAEWKPTVEALAGECGLKPNLSHGFEAVQGFVAGIGE